jgi:hypothetical protein
MPNGASSTRRLHKRDANSSSNKLPERLETSLGTYRKGFEAAPLLDLERDAPAEYHDRLTVAFALAIEEASKLHLAAESLIVSARCDSPKHQNTVSLFFTRPERCRFIAKLVGRDPGTDLAVLRLQGAQVPSGAFLDRRRLKPAPGMRRPTSGLHPPFVHLVSSRSSPRRRLWTRQRPPKS